MFERCHKLKEIKGINNFETSEVTNMSQMFEECYILENLDLSQFDFSNVINMGWMFNKCHKLKEIKGIKNFKNYQLKEILGMFGECNELEFIDLSNFDISNVEDLGWMFNGCYKLKEIKGINNFNTSNVKNMKEMFAGCKALEYLDLSNFKTFNFTDMTGMFKECHKLRQIKGINNFKFYKNIKINDMFKGCSELKDLDLSDYNNSINDNNNNNERPIEIKFVSVNQQFEFTNTFNITDNFSKIQKELYDKFQLKTKNIFFICNGIIVNKSVTLEKNKIKSKSIIVMDFAD